jgi:hypothetical protein
MRCLRVELCVRVVLGCVRVARLSLLQRRYRRSVWLPKAGRRAAATKTGAAVSLQPLVGKLVSCLPVDTQTFKVDGSNLA